MKYFFVFFLAFTVTAAYAGNSISRVGYLKDSSKNRIFTLSFPENMTEKEILNHAKSLPNTSGRMTAAYYFTNGSNIPSDSITLAGNVFKANGLLFETSGISRWKYAYMKSFKGDEKFIDCQSNPGNDLCRAD